MYQALNAQQPSGRLYGVGVGPGDPELLTLKARRLIQNCDVVSYLCSTAGHAMARTIAADALASAAKTQRVEEAIIMPMSAQRDRANAVYDAAAQMLAEHLNAGKEVVFLCLGDPLFFGSFAYIHARLKARYAITIVPGVSAINTAAAALAKPLGLLAENVAIISGRQDDAAILKALQEFDNLAIMKPGRRRGAILTLIARAGRNADACYIEYASQAQQRIITDITQLEKTPGPYFAVFLVGRNRAVYTDPSG